MKQGYWTLDNIMAAKRLVKEMALISETGLTLRNEIVIDALLVQAKDIMDSVRSNKPADMVLPL